MLHVIGIFRFPAVPLDNQRMPRFRLRVWWWRWVIAVCAGLQIFATSGMLYNYSILFVSLQKDFDSGAVMAGWPGSLANCLANLMSPITALLMMKMKAANVVILGHVLLCVGSLLTSIINALGYAVFTFGVMTGVGVNFVVHAVTGMVLEWFPKDNFSRANGIVVTGSSSGLLAYSPLLTTFITQFGWRRALRYISVGTTGLGIVVSLLLSDPPTGNDDNGEGDDENKRGADEREQINLETSVGTLDPDHPTERTPVGEDLQDEEKPCEIKEDRIQTPSFKVEGSSCCVNSEICHMITHFDPWAWNIGACLAMVGWTFFTINFASFLDGRGLSSDRIAVVIMFFAVGEIGGKVLFTVIGDHLPCRRIYFMVASGLLGAITFGVMTTAHTFPQMMALSIFSGFMRSLLYAHSSAVCAEYFFNTYSSNGVMILAIFPYGVGVLLNVPLSGGLYDVTGNYILSLGVISAIFILAALSFLSIDFHQRFASGDCPCFFRRNRPEQL